MVGSTVPTIPRFQNPPDSVIRDILSQPRRIAVVGCSPDPSRDSHRIARLLIDKGHRVVPVHPGATRSWGRCYPSLRSIPDPIDMVDIFRRADQAGPIVDEAIAVGAQIVWMQLGVIDAAAARAHRRPASRSSWIGARPSSTGGYFREAVTCEDKTGRNGSRVLRKDSMRWERLASEIIYRCRIFSVRRDHSRSVQSGAT